MLGLEGTEHALSELPRLTAERSLFPVIGENQIKQI